MSFYIFLSLNITWLVPYALFCLTPSLCRDCFALFRLLQAKLMWPFRGSLALAVIQKDSLHIVALHLFLRYHTRGRVLPGVLRGQQGDTRWYFIISLPVDPWMWVDVCVHTVTERFHGRSQTVLRLPLFWHVQFGVSPEPKIRLNKRLFERPST